MKEFFGIRLATGEERTYFSPEGFVRDLFLLGGEGIFRAEITGDGQVISHSLTTKECARAVVGEASGIIPTLSFSDSRIGNKSALLTKESDKLNNRRWKRHQGYVRSRLSDNEGRRLGEIAAQEGRLAPTVMPLRTGRIETP